MRSEALCADVRVCREVDWTKVSPPHWLDDTNDELTTMQKAADNLSGCSTAFLISCCAVYHPSSLRPAAPMHLFHACPGLLAS